MTMTSQNIAHFQWEKRVIVIYGDSFENDQLQEQVKKLKQAQEQFDEYRVVVVEHTNEGERTNFGAVKKVNVHEKIVGFKVFLIGLDGGVKFESSKVRNAQKFFDMINSMPMRQSELRTKGD